MVSACLPVYQPISYRLRVTSEVLALLVDSKNETYPYICLMPLAMLTASVCSFGCILPTRAVSFINLFLLQRCCLLNQLGAVDSAVCGMCVSE